MFLKVKEIQLCLYAAVHTSIAAIDHLIDLHRNHSDKNSAISIHLTKCTHVINNVIEPYFFDLLKDHLKNEKFSFIIDESSDIIVLKMLGLVIKYFSASEIVSRRKENCIHFFGIVAR